MTGFSPECRNFKGERRRPEEYRYAATTDQQFHLTNLQPINTRICLTTQEGACPWFATNIEDQAVRLILSLKSPPAASLAANLVGGALENFRDASLLFQGRSLSFAERGAKFHPRLMKLARHPVPRVAAGG